MNTWPPKTYSELSPDEVRNLVRQAHAERAEVMGAYLKSLKFWHRRSAETVQRQLADTHCSPLPAH